ncbi:hypothetical protein IGI37_002611 [Enterococcus sp. AZ194]|uniref:transcriptional regulator n=1 Tax=Enterococcus sp. AZ194 TaxID=2774629 RepID=UPI003F2184F1
MKFSILKSERTNNFTDPAIQTKILSLWEINASTVQETFEKGGTIVCVYHAYQTNYKGDYSVSLCPEEVADGIFDTTKYQWKEYIVDSDDKLGVINTWQKIWAEEDNQQIKRVYDFDFEQYKANGEVSIFVAID